MAQKYLFIAILCVKMSRVNKALVDIQIMRDIKGEVDRQSVTWTFYLFSKYSFNAFGSKKSCLTAG